MDARAAGAAVGGFVPNRGQLPAGIRFAAIGPGYAIAFERHRVRLSLADGKSSVRVALRFVGAGATSTVEATGRQATRVSFFLGHDSSRWLTGLPTYSTIVYRNVWRGIDARFTLHGGQLKYELVLRPGASAKDIRLAYDGASRLSVDRRGNLCIATARGTLHDERPTTYQLLDGTRAAVPSSYALRDGSYGFTVGSYDHRAPLTIDPGLAYSTFLGGSSSDGGLGITVDARGSAYVTGLTSSIDFPGTGTNAGSGDAFVAKLTPDGSRLVYAAFLGGTGPDEARGIAVDAAGNAYVDGFTQSADFPTAAATDSSYDGGDDAFFAKLDPTGSQLLVSTYLGGARDDRALALALDSAGNAHLTGETSSDDFPTTPGAYAQRLAGDLDVFVTKIDPTGRIAYSTFLGSRELDDGLAITVGPNGNAYVTGKASPGFPTTDRAYDTSPNGGLDAFVAELSADGSDLVYSTYLGGDNWDEGLGIGVDGSGSAYVTGNVQSPDFPTTAGAWDRDLSGPVDGFVTKLSADGSDLVYSTFLGGTDGDEPDGLAVDGAGRAYVAGHLLSDDYPTTDDAFNTRFNGVSDAFLTVLAPSGGALAYSTYLGGRGWDGGMALAIDGAGAAYVTGFSRSEDFPTSAQGFDTGFNGDEDVFVTKIEPGFLRPPPPPVPAPDYSLSALPIAAWGVSGEPTIFTVTVMPLQGFRNDVMLEVSGLPEGATASFSPNPTSTESTLTVQTTEETPPGTYPLTITGTSGALTRTAEVVLYLHLAPA